MNGLSNALIQQTGPSTQVETGTLELENYSNGGIPLFYTKTGLVAEDNGGVQLAPNTYGAYFTYNVTATGITGFGPNQSGTITSGTFAFYGDVGQNDIFNRPVRVPLAAPHRQ